jgi:hypothetical protein
MSVFWLALAAFAIGTEGFVIAGLLPAIATDLSISVSAAGQLVTAYALTYAVGSPILAVALNNIDRRYRAGSGADDLHRRKSRGDGGFQLRPASGFPDADGPGLRTVHADGARGVGRRRLA